MTSAFSAILVLLVGVHGLGTPVKAKTKTQLTLVELKTKLKTYTEMKAFETSFTQTKTLSSVGLSLKSKGTLSVERPHRVNWKITEPAPIEIKVDENKVLIVTGSGSDAQTQTVDLKQIEGMDGVGGFSSVSAWMKLDPEELYQTYEVYKIKTDVYRFVPKDKENKYFESIQMVLTPKGHLKTLLIHELSGDTLEIAFGAVKMLKGKK